MGILSNRYLTEEKERILLAILDNLPHGSGFDGEWVLRMTTSSRVSAEGEYHCMGDGSYDGWVYFTVRFDLEDPKYFKLTFFSDPRNRYKAEKYALRDYFEEYCFDCISKALDRD